MASIWYTLYKPKKSDRLEPVTNTSISKLRAGVNSESALIETFVFQINPCINTLINMSLVTKSTDILKKKREIETSEINPCPPPRDSIL